MRSGAIVKTGIKYDIMVEKQTGIEKQREKRRFSDDSKNCSDRGRQMYRMQR